MLLIAIESSTATSSVAVLDDRRVLASATCGMGKRHNEFLVPAIEFCLAQSASTVADVTAVAVGVGPGLYTGMRVGMATARMFASARDLPMVGVSGLDALAATVRGSRVVVPTIDARRGEVFWSLHVGDRVSDPEVGKVAELISQIEDIHGPVHVVGDPDGKVLADLVAANLPDVTIGGSGIPQAVDVGAIARRRLADGGGVTPGELAPLYLREVDVQIGWNTLHGRAGVDTTATA